MSHSPDDFGPLFRGLHASADTAKESSAEKTAPSDDLPASAHGKDLAVESDGFNLKHPVHIGTCGWSYKGWVGPFYPPGTPASEFLKRYARRFRFVEVDSTFYRCPAPHVVVGWREKTPEDFTFALKVPQTITHEKLLQGCAAEVDEFIAAARHLGPKLLCCLLQLGYINSGILRDLPAFLERLGPFLDTWPKDIPLAVEIRNKQWFTEEFAAFLRRRGVVWALSDQEWLAPLAALVQRLDTVTGPFAYLRLIGNRQEVEEHTTDFERVVVDRSAWIKADAQAIRWLAGHVPVVTFVNNHFAGHAPETIRMLREALRDAAG